MNIRLCAVCNEVYEASNAIVLESGIASCPCCFAGMHLFSTPIESLATYDPCGCEFCIRMRGDIDDSMLAEAFAEYEKEVAAA